MSDNTSDLVLQIGTLSLLSLYLFSPGGGVFFSAMNRTFVCIDLKSFYASVECVERRLDPLTTNLVVADPERGEKTICLAVSPSMKKLGVHNRCRVFEIPKHIEYITAPPRMQLYIDYSANIYAVYLKYVLKEDIHVYSIDEVFMDVTNYLVFHRMTPKQLAVAIMEDVLQTTGITATAGIGTNLYLAKIAMDIMAKHSDDHIGILTEQTYREQLWDHKPLTDFWRIGRGISAKLERNGMRTMGDIAQMSQFNEDLLYRLFGVDAELLIDHAWGREPTTIADIKAYKPQSHSISSGQVLPRNYSFDEGRLIVHEMTDLLVLDLVDKGLTTESVTLQLGYDNHLELKSGHGSIHLGTPTSSTAKIMHAVDSLYSRIMSRTAPLRRINLTFNNVSEETFQQCDLFSDPIKLERERNMQLAVLNIKKRYGKNAILKGMNLQAAATTMDRNRQIGGHKA